MTGHGCGVFETERIPNVSVLIWLALMLSFPYSMLHGILEKQNIFGLGIKTVKFTFFSGHPSVLVIQD